MKQILIRPDELGVSKDEVVFMSLALGSSLAICIYDETRHIGGMAHTLLPKSCSGMIREADKLRFVDSSVQALCDALLAEGAVLADLKAKLAGGARIFSFSETERHKEVGRENILCARQKLQELGIPLTSEDTGENYGRSVYFHTADGRLAIETMNRPRYWI